MAFQQMALRQSPGGKKSKPFIFFYPWLKKSLSPLRSAHASRLSSLRSGCG
jgi:hypothetical protein